MGKDNGGKLHAHADIHTVGFGWDFHIPAHLFHPLAAASAHRYNTLFTGIRSVFADHLVAVLCRLYGLYRRIKEKVRLVL